MPKNFSSLVKISWPWNQRHTGVKRQTNYQHLVLFTQNSRYLWQRYLIICHLQMDHGCIRRIPSRLHSEWILLEMSRFFYVKFSSVCPPVCSLSLSLNLPPPPPPPALSLSLSFHRRVVRCPLPERETRGSFSLVESNPWLQNGTLMATLPGTRRYRINVRSDRPGVSILWLSETASLICSCLIVAARVIVSAGPSLRYTSMLLGRSAASETLLSVCLSACLSLSVCLSLKTGRHHFSILQIYWFILCLSLSVSLSQNWQTHISVFCKFIDSFAQVSSEGV